MSEPTARDLAAGRKEVLIPGKGWHWVWCMSAPMVGVPTGECDCKRGAAS